MAPISVHEMSCVRAVVRWCFVSNQVRAWPDSFIPPWFSLYL
jgi:hypothetical protein